MLEECFRKASCFLHRLDGDREVASLTFADHLTFFVEVSVFFAVISALRGFAFCCFDVYIVTEEFFDLVEAFLLFELNVSCKLVLLDEICTLVMESPRVRTRFVAENKVLHLFSEDWLVNPFVSVDMFGETPVFARIVSHRWHGGRPAAGARLLISYSVRNPRRGGLGRLS